MERLHPENTGTSIARARHANAATRLASAAAALKNAAQAMSEASEALYEASHTTTSGDDGAAQSRVDTSPEESVWERDHHSADAEGTANQAEGGEYHVSDSGSPEYKDHSLSEHNYTESLFENDGAYDEPDLTRPSSNPERPTFETVLGHTYFALEEEFDAIPLMCFIAEMHRKTIFFLDEPGALIHYQKLFQEIIQQNVICPKAAAADPQTVEDAAQEFVLSQSPAVLLLPHSLKQLPVVLKDAAVDYAVYWGLQSTFQYPMRHRTQLASLSTSIIGTVAQRDRIVEKGRMWPPEHPSMAVLKLREEGSLLYAARNKTRSALVTDLDTVQKLHGAVLYHFAKVPRKVLSAEEVARRVNAFSAKVLLLGNPEDGSAMIPPVGERLSISSKVIKKFDLQAAVEAGLWNV